MIGQYFSFSALIVRPPPITLSLSLSLSLSLYSALSETPEKASGYSSKSLSLQNELYVLAFHPSTGATQQIKHKDGKEKDPHVHQI
jgi:hypothetical protein